MAMIQRDDSQVYLLINIKSSKISPTTFSFVYQSNKISVSDKQKRSVFNKKLLLAQELNFQTLISSEIWTNQMLDLNMLEI